MGTPKGKDRHQLYMAPSLEDTISVDNVVRIINALVESWDLEQLGFANVTPATTGRRSYAAKDMLKLYTCGYLSGLGSARKLASELGRTMELIWLLRALRSDHKTIAEFRRKNPQALENTFRVFVSILDESDVLGKEVIAVDGTKMRASNNKKRNMSKKKRNMSKKKLSRRIKHLDEKIDAYMRDPDTNDREESKAQYESYQQELEESGENE